MVHESTSIEKCSPQPEDAAWIALFDSPIGVATKTHDRPLEGLCFAVKDNIDVEAFPTTAACPTFASLAQAHAQVVQRLLDAGALLVGKTNMDQFACGHNGTRSPHGAVPNSFDPRYVCGGSSSGSAWVVAAGAVDFALGTDTAGSGRVPAGLNNIVGLKPTKGLVSTRGVLPAAQSVDCVSIFARTVELAAKVLAVAIGYDALDPYSRSLNPATTPLPSNLRVGIPSTLEFFGDTASADAFAVSLAQLEKLGATTVPIDYAPLSEAADLLYDSAMVAERYAAVRPFVDAHEDEIIEPVRSILARGKSYSAADLVDAQIRLRALAQQVAPMWDDIDILVVPTAPTHYTIEAMQTDPVVLNRNLGAYTNFVNLLDYAAISVPTCLRADGLPFGLTLIGPCGSDFQLAELAQRIHHATGLTQGATGVALPEPEALPMLVAPPAVETIRVAVVGAHLSGMPLNSQLTERGAVLLRETQTAAQYRLFALPGTVPPKPGMVRVPAAEGAALIVEIWEMPSTTYGSFVALIPAPLGIGTLVLADGSTVQGFVCESIALDGAEDITHHGGWRSYIASRRTTAA